MNFSPANVIDIQDKIEISFGIRLEIYLELFFSFSQLLPIYLNFLFIPFCMLKVDARQDFGQPESHDMCATKLCVLPPIGV